MVEECDLEDFKNRTKNLPKIPYTEYHSFIRRSFSVLPDEKDKKNSWVVVSGFEKQFFSSEKESRDFLVSNGYCEVLFENYLYTFWVKGTIYNDNSR